MLLLLFFLSSVSYLCTLRLGHISVSELIDHILFTARTPALPVPKMRSLCVELEARDRHCHKTVAMFLGYEYRIWLTVTSNASSRTRPETLEAQRTKGMDGSLAAHLAQAPSGDRDIYAGQGVLPTLLFDESTAPRRDL